MGYDDMLQEEPRTALSTAQHMLGLCVRLLGLAVLVAGVWTAVIVITEAWGLYPCPLPRSNAGHLFRASISCAS